LAASALSADIAEKSRVKELVLTDGTEVLPEPPPEVPELPEFELLPQAAMTSAALAAIAAVRPAFLVTEYK
jgi:hypothetical protein